MDKIKLTWGQVAVLAITSLPMAAAGIAGGIASYFNFREVLSSGSNALSLVLAGEGTAVICALVALSVTLMGQHTPTPVRAGLWLIPMAASVAGGIVAPDVNTRVVMILAPLAMTASGEGTALVARRIVAHRTGVDIEQQRRSGLLLWHAQRAANGKGFAKWRSERAVWRLTKSFAATDTQMSVQLGEVQRYRIGEGADTNLHSVLSGRAMSQPETLAATPVAPTLPEAKTLSRSGETRPALAETSVAASHELSHEPSHDDGYDFIKDVLDSRTDKDWDADATGLLTVADVASQRGVSTSTVRTWMSRGKNGVKLHVHDRDANGRALFLQSDVDRLL